MKNVIASNFVEIDQQTEEWYQTRLGIPTASKFGIIMANHGKAFGEPAKKYAIKLAVESLTGIKDSSEDFTNTHMLRGIEQESIAREIYEMQNFVNVLKGGFFHCGYFGGSPDGIIENDRLIEIKSVIQTTHYATLKRGAYDPAYKWQLIGNLLCSNYETIDFISYCSTFPEHKQLLVYTVERTNDIEDEIKLLHERIEEVSEYINQTKETIEN